MTEMFCDYTNGNDDTGDGSRLNPYKTINQASTGLTGGDFVKSAKSPDDIPLSGTMTWTNNSTTINTSADLRAVVFAKDLVRKTTLQNDDYEVCWEVSSVSANTITLVQSFMGKTESGISSVKIGVTDTGAAPLSTTIVQQLVGEGSSLTSKLNVSGGWDLSQNPPVRNGKTVFWQSGANKWGTGFQTNNLDFLEIEYLAFARYLTNLKFNQVYGARAYEIGCFAAGSYAINTGEMTYGIFENVRTVSGVQNWANTCYSLKLINCIALRTLYITFHSVNVEMTNVKWLGANGIEANCRAVNLKAVNCDFSNMAWKYYNESLYQKFYNCKFYSISYDADVLPQYNANELPVMAIKRYNQTKNDDRVYMYQGYIKRNVADAKSGACMQMIPYSATYPLIYKFWGIPADEGVAKAISFFIKKSADFNGSGEVALLYNGEVVDGWDSLSLTTSYVQKSVATSGTPIVEDGIFELAFSIKGSVGSIFVDELELS